VKRTIYYLPLFALAILAVFGLRQAFWQSESDKVTAQVAENADATAQNLNPNAAQHKIFVDAKETEVYQNLANQGAIVSEIDYGSFKMLTVKTENIGGDSQF
jgi:hypothetical protein